MRTTAEIRGQFEFIEGGSALFDHAGGTPVPKQVSQAIRNHFAGNNVNSGAIYPESLNAKTILENARILTSNFFGIVDKSSISFGPSSSQLLANLSQLLLANFSAGDEIILAQWNHESNVAPWLRLQAHGIKIKWWHLNSDSQRCEIQDLVPLLNGRTKLVCTTQVSNILGGIEDLSEVISLSHKFGAQVVCDAVATVPHMLLDVIEGDVDWVFSSLYKAMAPHWACLYGKKSCWENLGTLNFEVYPTDTLGYKLELGVPNFEAAAGMSGLFEYHSWLAESREAPRDILEKSYQRISEVESDLNTKLFFGMQELGYKILGPKEIEKRISLMSFLPKKHAPLELAMKANNKGLGIKFGHVCSPRTLDALGIDRETGISRFSVFHGNSLEEIERLLSFMKEIDA